MRRKTTRVGWHTQISISHLHVFLCAVTLKLVGTADYFILCATSTRANLIVDEADTKTNVIHIVNYGGSLLKDGTHCSSKTFNIGGSSKPQIRLLLSLKFEKALAVLDSSGSFHGERASYSESSEYLNL